MTEPASKKRRPWTDEEKARFSKLAKKREARKRALRKIEDEFGDSKTAPGKQLPANSPPPASSASGALGEVVLPQPDPANKTAPIPPASNTLDYNLIRRCLAARCSFAQTSGKLGLLPAELEARLKQDGTSWEREVTIYQNSGEADINLGTFERAKNGDPTARKYFQAPEDSDLSPRQQAEYGQRQVLAALGRMSESERESWRQSQEQRIAESKSILALPGSFTSRAEKPWPSTARLLDGKQEPAPIVHPTPASPVPLDASILPVEVPSDVRVHVPDMTSALPSIEELPVVLD
jgi:hypothetical protein